MKPVSAIMLTPVIDFNAIEQAHEQAITTYVNDPKRDEKIHKAIDNPARDEAVNKAIDDYEDQLRMAPDAYTKKRRDENDDARDPRDI